MGEDHRGDDRLDDVGIRDDLDQAEATSAGTCEKIDEEHSAQKISMEHFLRARGSGGPRRGGVRGDRDHVAA